MVNNERISYNETRGEKMLRLENVKKTYVSKIGLNKYEALKGISFEVGDGEFVSIMGPSGSGKTTLLNMLGTIDTVSSGAIYIDNVDLTKMKKKELSDYRREKIGFIFQDFNLLNTLTLKENILLPIVLGESKHKIDFKKLQEVKKKIGISHILNKYPYEVSGGERQRTACARAIITNPKIILADEPTGNLDSKSSQELLSMLELLNKEYNITILMVTHDIFAASYSDRVLFIRDGKLYNELIKEGPRKEFFDAIIDFEATLGGGVE